MLHLPALMALLSLALTDARQVGATSNHSLGQWLYGVNAVTLPEFFSTDPGKYEWEPHASGQAGTLTAVTGGMSATAMPWAAVRWKLDASPWWGQRVQFGGTLIARGIRSARPSEMYVGAGLFVRVVDIVGVTLALDNMILRTFVSYEEAPRFFKLVVDVPRPPQSINEDSCPLVGPAFIHLGFYLIGRSGSVRLAPPGQFTAVSKADLLTAGWSGTSGPGVWW